MRRSRRLSTGDWCFALGILVLVAGFLAGIAVSILESEPRPELRKLFLKTR
jgi:hypothetical protein